MTNAIDLAERAGYSIKQIADALGDSVQTVSNWRARGVPLDKCSAFERVTNGTVMRWHLRPEDWHHHWPELVRKYGAPKVKKAKA